jgi:transcriptional regulator with XRE-family HTH domain
MSATPDGDDPESTAGNAPETGHDAGGVDDAHDAGGVDDAHDARGGLGELSAEAPGWYDAEATTFGDRMTGAREAAGMSQAELAKRLGVKVKTIRAWENDRSEPRANRLQMLAGMMGVSIMWLLNGEGDGLDGPVTPQELPEDLAAILKDLRALRVEQSKLAETTSRLEKRLRAALSAHRI